MWRRDRGKEIWTGFVHRHHIRFFEQLGKHLLSKWNVDISISAEPPDYAIVAIDLVSILVEESDVFLVDASFWLDNPRHIGRFLPHFSFDSYFIFYTHSAEKEQIIKIVTLESASFFTRPMVIPDITQANFIAYDPGLTEDEFSTLFEQISKTIENLRRKRVFICHASEDKEFTRKRVAASDRSNSRQGPTKRCTRSRRQRLLPVEDEPRRPGDRWR